MKIKCRFNGGEIERRKDKSKFKGLAYIFILFRIFLFIVSVNASVNFANAQGSPHNVEGYIFKSDGTTGIGNLPVRINNTINEHVSLAYSQALPPFAPFLGKYSATIEGNDGDLINVTSWNATHFGFNATTLASTTTYANITLNIRRNSETNVTIISPANNSIRNTTTSFNITSNVTILGNDGANCNATIIFSNDVANITADQNFTNLLGDISFQNSELAIWNLTALKEGIFNVTVKAQCSFDDVNLDNADFYTISLSISDTTMPSVNLISPLNNSKLNAPNITFNYNVSEGTGLNNCSLYLNDNLNQTTYYPPPNSLINFTVNNTFPGLYNWFISCFDSSSNFNQGNSSIRLFNLDLIFPNITLMSPANDTATPNNTLLFRYNITDNFDIANCSLIINNEIKTTNYSISLNISNNFTRRLTGSNYTWHINCTDNASNTFSSTIFFLNISDPDLKVNSSDIVFNPSNFVEGQNITINATIFNLGNENATNVTVTFFENDPDDGGKVIGNKTANVTIGGNVTISETYVTRIGKADIFVVLDPELATNGSLIETNESNNVANSSIDITAYHIFYGEIVSDIFLDTSSNTTVFAWLNSTDLDGNIFAADSDSSINFDSLQALTRNTTGNLTIDDFEELDIALNTKNLSDSMNRTYTESNDTANFTIFNSLVYYVPTVNSTNSSNFITGILWDTNDFTSIGFYNGSQDVIFVTKISENSPGLYGMYDYEIKIPATLRSYVSPNEIDSLSFYREIT